MFTTYDFSLEHDRSEYYRKMLFYSDAIEPSVCSFDGDKWICEEHVNPDKLPKEMAEFYQKVESSLPSGKCIPAQYDGRYGIVFHTQMSPSENGRMIRSGTFSLAISLKQMFSYPVFVLYNYNDGDEGEEHMSDVEMFIDFESAQAADLEKAAQVFEDFDQGIIPGVTPVIDTDTESRR